jgi:ABC-type nickel/cobalt efflux system permease component RcnA
VVLPSPTSAGGLEAELSNLVSVRDLTPAISVATLVLAVALGAAHALSPGHGKSLMAAYILGVGGSFRGVASLGVAVTASHTLGVLGLAAVIGFAGQIIAPDRLYPVLRLASGGFVLCLGLWLVGVRIRAWRLHRSDSTAGHVHGSTHQREGRPTVIDGPSAVSHTHHHGVPHSHDHLEQRAAAATSTRAMAGLGFAGGLVPSPSALLLLLGSVAAGRLGYGVILVFAFGIGMGAVMVAIGFLLARGRALLERRTMGDRFERLQPLLSLASAIVVLGVGLALTTQALTG